MDVLEQKRKKYCAGKRWTTKLHLLLPKLLFLVDIPKLPVSLIYFTDKDTQFTSICTFKGWERAGGLANERTNELTNVETNEFFDLILFLNLQ
jgi:hypothetical protein